MCGWDMVEGCLGCEGVCGSEYSGGGGGGGDGVDRSV